MQVEVEVHNGERGEGRLVLVAVQSEERRQEGEVKEIRQEDSDIELEENFVARQRVRREKLHTTRLGEYQATQQTQTWMTDINV